MIRNLSSITRCAVALALPRPRLAVLCLALVSTHAVSASAAESEARKATVTYPEVSEKDCPAEVVSITGRQGNPVTMAVRKPPGPGPFPAMVVLHGGLDPRPLENLKRDALDKPSHTRFLAAGYVTVTPTFRSRDKDPQTRDALEDCLAVIEHVKKMPAVDAGSVAVFGGSGGGSLGLELAGESDLCAVVAGEPASVLFSGMMTSGMSERGPNFQAIMKDPKQYYTPALQEFTRAKIAKIHCPVLFALGDKHPIVKINHDIIIPEMQAAKKALEVIVYPGQPHSFYWGAGGDPAAGEKFFNDARTFLKKYVKTQPVPLAESLIKRMPIPSGGRNGRSKNE